MFIMYHNDQMCLEITSATFFFPIILSLKKNDSIELEFEETYEELIEKEIELLQ